MKRIIRKHTLQEWLANQAKEFDLAVTHFNSELQKTGFTCLSHALSQRGKSKDFFIEFFTQNRILLEEKDFLKASLDEIKHELELAFKFCDAYLKTHIKKEEVPVSVNQVESDDMYIKPSEKNSAPVHEVKNFPMKPVIEQTVLKEGTLYIRRVKIAA
jgi:hypothetical protein